MNRQETRRKRLQTLIDRAGSQEALARRINTSPAYISQMLTGTRNVSNGSVERIEEAMGVPVGWMDQWVQPEPQQLELPPSDKSLLNAYHQLPKELRMSIRATIESTAVLLNPKFREFAKKQQKLSRSRPKTAK